MEGVVETREEKRGEIGKRRGGAKPPSIRTYVRSPCFVKFKKLLAEGRMAWMGNEKRGRRFFGRSCVRASGEREKESKKRKENFSARVSL